MGKKIYYDDFPTFRRFGNYIRLTSAKLLIGIYILIGYWSDFYNTFGRKETWLRRQEREFKSKKLQQEDNLEDGRDEGLKVRRDRWTTIRRISLLCNESLFERDVESKRKANITARSEATTAVRHGSSIGNRSTKFKDTSSTKIHSRKS